MNQPSTPRAPRHWRGFAQLAALVVVGCAGLLLLVSCGLGGEAKSDAPDVDCSQPGNCTPLRNTKILKEPEGFRNISFGCFGTNGVYVTSRGIYEAGGQNAVPLPSSVTVVPGDPQCAQ